MIRTAVIKDAAGILSLFIEGNLIHEGEEKLFNELIALKIKKDPDLVIVACDIDGNVIGCILGIYDPMASYLRLLAVKSTYRRMGIGTSLVNEMVGRLAKCGALSVCALMYDWNEASTQLFKKMDWTQLDDCHCFFTVCRLTYV